MEVRKVLVEVRTSSNNGIQFVEDVPAQIDKPELRVAKELIMWIKAGEVVNVELYGSGEVQYVNFATVQSFRVRLMDQE